MSKVRHIDDVAQDESDDTWLELPKKIPVSYEAAQWVFTKIDEEGAVVPKEDMFRWNRGRTFPWPRAEVGISRCMIHGDPRIKANHDPNTYAPRPYVAGAPLQSSHLSDVKPTWRGGSGPGHTFLSGCAEEYELNELTSVF